MFASSPLARDVAARQTDMFAMFVGKGLRFTREALSAATGIPAPSLREYANGASMPIAVALALSRALPPEAMNMIYEAGGKRLVNADAHSTNWDMIAAEAAGLVSEVCAARADGEINHSEDARLRKLARKLIADAQGAVAS